MGLSTCEGAPSVNLCELCHSLQEAMSVVEKLTPRAVWRESAPGFWVARTV